MTDNGMSVDTAGAADSAPQRAAAINRRAFLVRAGTACLSIGMLSAGAELLAACGSSGGKPAGSNGAAKPTPLKLQESYINNAEFAGYYVAAKKGYFAKYGLDVDIISAGTTTDPRTVVANGAAPIGFVSETSDTLIGIAHGVPYKCFGATFQENPGCLMVLAKSGIHGVQGLRGKTIGLQENARQQVIGILKANGLSPSDVTLTVVGDDPTPLVLGKIDAYTAFAFNEPIALKMKGINTECFSFSTIGLPGYGDNLIATTDTINSQPDMLARFVRASQEGWQDAIKNPADAVSITLHDYPSGQNPTQQKLQMQTQIPMLTSAGTKAHGLLWIDKTIWAGAIKAAEASHQLAKPVTVDQTMTQEILLRAAQVKPS